MSTLTVEAQVEILRAQLAAAEARAEAAERALSVAESAIQTLSARDAEDAKERERRAAKAERNRRQYLARKEARAAVSHDSATIQPSLSPVSAPFQPTETPPPLPAPSFPPPSFPAPHLSPSLPPPPITPAPSQAAPDGPTVAGRPAAGVLELEAQGCGTGKPRRQGAAGEWVAWVHADRAQRLGAGCARPDPLNRGAWARVAELLRDHGRKTAEAAWTAYAGDPGAVERGLPVAMFVAQWARWVSEAQRSGPSARRDVKRGAVRAEDMAQAHRDMPVGVVEDW